MKFKPHKIEPKPYERKEPVATSIPASQYKVFKDVAQQYELTIAQLLRQMINHCMEDLDG
jgi:hypothetical protein